MSTHCGIAIKTEKGYETIYCHNNGNPSYMLPLLKENYNTEELAAKIISLGDASSLDRKLEPTTTTHRFGNAEPGVSVFYNRDRGEDYNSVIFETKEQLFDTYYYVYIFEGGDWTAYQDRNKVLMLIQ